MAIGNWTDPGDGGFCESQHAAACGYLNVVLPLLLLLLPLLLLLVALASIKPPVNINVRMRRSCIRTADDNLGEVPRSPRLSVGFGPRADPQFLYAPLVSYDEGGAGKKTHNFCAILY